MNIDDLFVQFVETLDREVELLTTIRYRLIVLGAIAAFDQGDVIPKAVQEVEVSSEELKVFELLRASITIQLTDELNLDANSQIEEIAHHAQGAWEEILLDRRQSLKDSMDGIQELANSVCESMERRAALIEEALKFIRTGSGTTYGRTVSRGGVLVEGAI